MVVIEGEQVDLPNVLQSALQAAGWVEATPIMVMPENQGDAARPRRRLVAIHFLRSLASTTSCVTHPTVSTTTLGTLGRM